MTARGIRNNNPGNIRHNPRNKWDGMSPEQKDPDFVSFVSMAYGCRALMILLKNYANKGFNTPESIIRRFAPSNENNTESYIRSVCQQLTVYPDEPMNFREEPQLLIDFAKAVARHENGRDADLIDEETWNKAYEMV